LIGGEIRWTGFGNVQAPIYGWQIPLCCLTGVSFTLASVQSAFTAMLTKDEDRLDAMAIWRRITSMENLLFQFEKIVISQASKNADLKKLVRTQSKRLKRMERKKKLDK
jgi:hypothetical protein